MHAPAIIAGPNIFLSLAALPWYVLLSVGRMFVAYLLSLAFTLVYGYVAARNRTAEKILMPLLDVLQSVPILSFLPVVLLSLSVVLPVRPAAELAAIVLIFTSQAWNMTYSFYQSVSTVTVLPRIQQWNWTISCQSSKRENCLALSTCRKGTCC
jgi:NitT/TauT family transport system permease protein